MLAITTSMRLFTEKPSPLQYSKIIIPPVTIIPKCIKNGKEEIKPSYVTTSWCILKNPKNPQVNY